MNNILPPAARKANDIAAYAKNAKAARAKVRREFRKAVEANGSYTFPENWTELPAFQDLVSAYRWKESSLAELQAVRELPLSYYE